MESSSAGGVYISMQAARDAIAGGVNIWVYLGILAAALVVAGILAALTGAAR